MKLKKMLLTTAAPAGASAEAVLVIRPAPAPASRTSSKLKDAKVNLTSVKSYR
ncbi:MAG: hypothetical protein PUH94_06860 [Firmicutes bacterium]|nr:hypothetical protein [Bacillota bacterium]